MPFAHTSDKNRYPIFLMPVPSKIDFSFLQHCGTTVLLIAEFAGCRDRPKINFKTAVAEGKRRRHPDLSGTPASRAVKMLFPNYQALFCEPLPKRTDV
jgi:hypothetical protein